MPPIRRLREKSSERDFVNEVYIRAKSDTRAVYPTTGEGFCLFPVKSVGYLLIHRRISRSVRAPAANFRGSLALLWVLVLPLGPASKGTKRGRERERTSGGDVNRVGERAAGKKRGETARERGE